MKNNSKETNRIKEPSKFSVKFANTVFVLGVLFSVLVSVYAVYKIYNSPVNLTLTFYFSFLLFAVLSSSLLVLGLKKLSDDLKVNMSVLLITVGISVYGFETYLKFSEKTREIIAKQMGVPYDTRTSMEVLDDLRDSGVEAYPNVRPTHFTNSNGLTANKGRIYPLGSISNSKILYGNEAGYYPIIEADEYGFNNPKGLYNKNKVDIILTGDSFTEGRSVHSDENISAVLRKLHFNAISIGKGGNGSLIELAALKEYAEPLKPKVVLWLYNMSDIGDLAGEMESSILKKYLNEDDYSQNLISRQEEIDDVLINYVQSEWKRKKTMLSKTHAKRIIKLHNLRKRINLIPTPTPLPNAPPEKVGPTRTTSFPDFSA